MSPHYLYKNKYNTSYYFGSYIPLDLLHLFDGRIKFLLSLKCGNKVISKKICLYLNKQTQILYEQIRMGKSLSIDEMKRILKKEIEKSKKHSSFFSYVGVDRSKEKTKQEGLKTLQKEEIELKSRKKTDFDDEVEKLLKDEGITDINRKSGTFRVLRENFIKIQNLKIKWKREIINGEINAEFDLVSKILDGEDDFIDEIIDKKDAFARRTHLQPDEPTELELQEKLQQSESILGSRILRNDIEKTAPEPKDEVNEKVETILISKLIDEYIEETERQKGLREKTIVEYKSVLLMMVEVIGDVPINELSQKHGRLFSSTLEKLPPRRKSDGRFKNKSIKEIVQMDVQNTMDTRTINTLIQRCSSWFNWVIRKGYYEDRNIFHGKSIPSKKGKNDITRQPYNEEQLKLIFSKNYLNKTLNSVSPCRYVFYWVGILGLFHGTRLQETTQLHINDIYPLNKIWVIDINDNTKDKKLKTTNSKRIIPLHQTLIDLGFLEYLKIIEQKGKERVFHELTLGRDGYTKNPSKFFNDYLRELDIKSPTKKYDFHSLRHTCNNALIQKDVIEEHRNDYLGWGQTGMSKKIYGKPFEPSILKKRCSNYISFQVKWNDLKVDWKNVIG